MGLTEIDKNTNLQSNDTSRFPHLKLKEDLTRLPGGGLSKVSSVRKPGSEDPQINLSFFHHTITKIPEGVIIGF